MLSTAAGSEVANSTTRYLPFGGYRGTAPTQTITDRDFTGQKENRELGLLYYNARYYAPGLGRFLSADTIVPDPMNPQQYNRYSYVLNSPMNFTDPTGHYCQTIGVDTAACAYAEKQYDLTGWLPNVMRRGAQSEELELMRDNISTGPMGFPSGVWFEELTTTFLELNGAYGQWDVKRETLHIVQEGVTLCGNETCRWVDYSTPGNILFGYVAASAGVPSDMSRVAGGGLEVWEGTANIDNIGNAFEDPYDSAAVDFGYHLYDTYGNDITLGEFRDALTTDILESFQPPPEGFIPPHPPVPQINTYPVGSFDCFSENGCIAP